MTMAQWNGSDLARVDAAEELDLASERPNGALRDAVTMRVARSGDGLYVRSVKGTEGPWWRGTRSRNRGRVSAGGVARDVVLHRADPGGYPVVDAAYRETYGRCTGIVEHVLTDAARASALRLEPR